jgi:hypothetical protein
MGLFLGASILSVTELVEFLLLMLAKKRWTTKKDNVTTDDDHQRVSTVDKLATDTSV